MIAQYCISNGIESGATTFFWFQLFGVNEIIIFLFFLCISNNIFHGQEQHVEAATNDRQTLVNKINLLKEKIQEERIRSIKVSSFGWSII